MSWMHCKWYIQINYICVCHVHTVFGSRWYAVRATNLWGKFSVPHLFNVIDPNIAPEVTCVKLKKISTCMALKTICSCYRAVGLWFIVQRTKQCLDFSSTAHLIHLIVCWYYNGHFPSAFSWWLLNLACLTIMCVSGEFLCMRTELQAIPLNMGPKADL